MVIFLSVSVVNSPLGLSFFLVEPKYGRFYVYVLRICDRIGHVFPVRVCEREDERTTMIF